MGKGNGKRVSFRLTDDTGRERVVTPVRRRGPRPRIPAPPQPPNRNYDNVKVNVTVGEIKKLGIFRPCQVKLDRLRPPPPPQPEVASSSSRSVVHSRGNRVTTPRQRYHCDKCTRNYSSRQSLNQHKMVHQVPNRFRCGICGKRYNYRDNLSYHQKTHLGFQPGGLRLDRKEKPFHCSVCGQRFINVSNLYYHAKMSARCHGGGNAYRLKNAAPRPKPFCCPKCSKSFVLKTDLDHHFGFHRENEGA